MNPLVKEPLLESVKKVANRWILVQTWSLAIAYYRSV